nr:EOG090X0NBB [Triops cancriformis]
MSAKNETPQEIDLTKLSLPQLTQLKQQFDQELALCQDSLQTLKMAQGKFQESSDTAEKLQSTTEGSDVLVPLTGSMYVPGKMVQPDVALIEIGTGYYAEKKMADAKDYFKRRVKFLTEQIEKLQLIGLEKSKIREAIMEVMEMKMQNRMSQTGATRQ